MPDALNIRAEIRKAREQGYFDLSQLKGRYSREQLGDLLNELDRKHIPREPPGRALGRLEEEMVRTSVSTRVDMRTARSIINSLRTGTVPPCDLTPLSVGRQRLGRQMVEDLTQVAEDSARVRFLNAAYGAGKTHSLWLLAETAFRQNFAVSFVTLNPRTCPLHSLLTVYGAILDGIRTSGTRGEPGLQRVLDRWIDIVNRDGQDVARDRIRQLAPHFVTALAEYAGARLNPIRPNPERQLFLLNYLSGRRVLRRDLSKLDISHIIDNANALATLREITILIRQLGFRGLCIFLDEAESVLSFSRFAQVDEGYRNLLRIVEAGPGLRSCYFVYAATPVFFDGYAAYWGAAASIQPAHIYELDRLSRDEYVELGERIAGIYSVAYDRSAAVEKLHAVATPLAEEANDVGTFVRAVVAILDRERRGG